MERWLVKTKREAFGKCGHLLRHRAISNARLLPPPDKVKAACFHTHRPTQFTTVELPSCSYHLLLLKIVKSSAFCYAFCAMNCNLLEGVFFPP
mmetsp:Transcript_131565/g.228707  ORF Transcript_131565/g.228707 Transcript_131565/m.228707 type:complete len:93 (-) Transcript_131565:50-328(-)